MLIAQTFGMMTMRLRFIFKPAFAIKVIAHCATLHNVCMTSVEILQLEGGAQWEEYEDTGL